MIEIKYICDSKKTNGTFIIMKYNISFKLIYKTKSKKKQKEEKEKMSYDNEKHSN